MQTKVIRCQPHHIYIYTHACSAFYCLSLLNIYSKGKGYNYKTQKNKCVKIVSNQLTCLQIPSGYRVKWTADEHVALHKLFGAYRGTSISITKCIRPVLQCYPITAELLNKRSVSDIRDKIKGFCRKY